MVQPLANKLVVEKVVVKNHKYGNIHLPDSLGEKEMPHQCRVVEVGPDCQTLKKGDLVIISRFGGTAFKHEGKDYHILMEWDVLAKVDETATD